MRTFTNLLVGLNLSWTAWVVASSRWRPHDLVISWKMLVLGFCLWVTLVILLTSLRRESFRLEATRYVVLRGSVNCPGCGFLLDRDDQHCARCGEAVQQLRTRVRCEACKGRNWDDDLFCRSCGTTLQAEEAPTSDPGEA